MCSVIADDAICNLDKNCFCNFQSTPNEVSRWLRCQQQLRLSTSTIQYCVASKQQHKSTCFSLERLCSLVTCSFSVPLSLFCEKTPMIHNMHVALLLHNVECRYIIMAQMIQIWIQNSVPEAYKYIFCYLGWWNNFYPIELLAKSIIGLELRFRSSDFAATNSFPINQNISCNSTS